MKVIYGVGNRDLKLPSTACAIGIFDGLHRGHQYLIGRMQASAKRLKAKSLVVTFFPHPAHVLRPDVALPYLVSLKQRLELLGAMGVDYCVVVRFTKAFAGVAPEVFIKNTLVKKLGVRAIFVGEDFRFGKDRRGDIALFKLLSKECGYDMRAMAPLTSGGEVISSSRIRRLIAEGQVQKAQRLLGHPIGVSGTVVKGSHRGKKLGFPTANVAYDCDILLPRGVYAVKTVIRGKTYKGVANIGIRPSFKEKNPKVHLEVHLFNFKNNIYGQNITVEFLHKLRDEQSFPNPQALIAQIKQDIRQAQRLI